MDYHAGIVSGMLQLLRVLQQRMHCPASCSRRRWTGTACPSLAAIRRRAAGRSSRTGWAAARTAWTRTPTCCARRTRPHRRSCRCSCVQERGAVGGSWQCAGKAAAFGCADPAFRKAHGGDPAATACAAGRNRCIITPPRAPDPGPAPAAHDDAAASLSPVALQFTVARLASSSRESVSPLHCTNPRIK